MQNVTMRITFVTRKFGNVERNSHCDVLHITPIRVANLVLDCNGDFAIKAYDTASAGELLRLVHHLCRTSALLFCILFWWVPHSSIMNSFIGSKTGGTSSWLQLPLCNVDIRPTPIPSVNGARQN